MPLGKLFEQSSSSGTLLGVTRPTSSHCLALRKLTKHEGSGRREVDYRPPGQHRQPTTPLERGLCHLYRLVIPGAILITICFLGYVVIGFSLFVAGIYQPTYSVMGFTDPIFISLSFLTGLFICAMSGSLAVLTFLLTPDDSRASFVVTMSLIAFGSGAATIRTTFEPVQACLTEIIIKLL